MVGREFLNSCVGVPLHIMESVDSLSRDGTDTP